jgi:hypothetical protein
MCDMHHTLERKYLIVVFLLGDPPGSEFYTADEDGTDIVSKRRHIKIQTIGNRPKGRKKDYNIQNTVKF